MRFVDSITNISGNKSPACGYFKKWWSRVKKTLSYFYQAMQLFLERKGSNLAAASSFYVVICTIPLTLLVIRLLGLIIGDLGKGQEQIFFYAESFFPDIAPEVLSKIKSMVAGPLFGGASFTFINLIVLLIASLSFFNSIWSGLFLITEERSYLSFWRNLKGIAIIGVTILLMVLSLGLPALFIFFVELAQQNFVVNFLHEFAPVLRPWIEYYQNFDLKQSFFLTSNLLHAVLFVAYFTFLYRWFFSWKVPLFNSFLAALAFVFSLLAGKSLFLLYVYYVRDNLVRQYGDFYTAILALMWVYFVMCFFYFSACLCHIMRDDPIYDQVKQKLSSFFQKLKPGAS